MVRLPSAQSKNAVESRELVRRCYLELAACERGADGGEELLRMEGFREQTRMGCNEWRQQLQPLGISGNNKGRQLWADSLDLGEQLEAVHAGHVDVRDQAVDLLHILAAQQCRGRRKRAHRVVRGLQQMFERPQNARIVIDDSNDESVKARSHGILALNCEVSGIGTSREERSTST